MPLDNDEVADLKSMIGVSRKREVNFGLALGKKRDSTALVTHRIKDGPVLMRQARKMDGVDASKSTHGTMRTKGKVIMLTCTIDPPPGLALKCRQFLNDIGMPMKVKVLNPAGETLDEDGEGEEDAVDETEAPVPPEALKWAMLVQKLEPKVLAFLKTGVGDVSRVRAAWNYAKGMAEEGDFKGAMKVAARVTAMMTDKAPDQVTGTKPLDTRAAGEITQALKTLGEPVTDASKVLPARATEAKNLMVAIRDAVTERDYDLGRVTLRDLEAFVDDARKHCEDEMKRLEPELLNAFQGGKGNLDKLRNVWAFAQSKFEKASYASTKEALVGLEKAIGTALTADKSEAQAEVDESPSVKVSEVVGDDLMKEIKSKASEIAEARKTLPDRAGDLDKAIKAIGLALKGNDEAIALKAKRIFDKILEDAEEHRRLLAEAHQEAEHLRQNVAELRGTYQTAFGNPLLDKLKTPLEALETMLAVEGSTDLPAVQKAVEDGRRDLETSRNTGTELLGQKKQWQVAHARIDPRLKALSTHAQAGSDGVKDAVDTATGALTDAANLATAHDYTGAVQKLQDVLTKCTTAEALADDCAHYKTILADRETRVGNLPATDPLAFVNDTLIKIRADLQEAKDATPGDFAKAVRLLEDVGRQIPVAERRVHLGANFNTTREKLKTDLEAIKVDFDKIAADVKDDPKETQHYNERLVTLNRIKDDFYTASDVATTNDLRKSMELVGRGAKMAEMLSSERYAWLFYTYGIFFAKIEIGKLDGRRGETQAYLAPQIERHKNDFALAQNLAASQKYKSGRAMLDKVKAEATASGVIADTFEDYLTELEQTNDFEAEDPATHALPMKTEVAACKTWRAKARTLAGAVAGSGDLKAAKDAATRASLHAENYEKVGGYSKDVEDLFDDFGKTRGAAASRWPAAAKLYGDILGGIQGASHDDHVLVTAHLTPAAQAYTRADTASKPTTLNWEEAYKQLQIAINFLMAAGERQDSLIAFDWSYTKTKERVWDLEDPNSHFTVELDAIVDKIETDALGFADAGNWAAAEAKLTEAEEDCIKLCPRITAYKEHGTLRTGDIQTTLTALNDINSMAGKGVDPSKGIKPAIDAYVLDVAAADTKRTSQQEIEGLKELQALKTRGETLKASLEQLKQAQTDMGTWVTADNMVPWIQGQAFLATEAAEITRRTEKLDKMFDEMMFKEVSSEASEIRYDINMYRMFSREHDAFTPKRTTAHTELSKLGDPTKTAKDARVVAPLHPAFDRLAGAFRAAEQQAAARVFKPAGAEMEKITAEIPKLLAIKTAFELYEPVTTKLAGEPGSMSGEYADNATIALAAKDVTSKLASLMVLEQALDFTKAKDLAEKIVETIKNARDAAKQLSDAGELEKTLGTKEDTDVTGLADEIEAVQRLIDALESHEAKDAVAEERLALGTLITAARRVAEQSETAPARKALAKAATDVKTALNKADQSAAVVRTATETNARAIKLADDQVTPPPALVTKFTKLKKQAATSLSIAQGGQFDKAATALAVLHDELDKAEDIGTRHMHFQTERDKAPTVTDRLAALEQHSCRYAISREIGEVREFMNEAVAKTASLEPKLALEALINARTACDIAEVKAKMHKNAEAVTEDDIKKILEGPAGPKELDKIIQTLDPQTKRRACTLALELRFDMKLKQYADAQGNTPEQDEAGLQKRAPNVTKLYDIMSRLPESHTTKNPSLGLVKNLGSQTMDVGTSSFSGGKLELRVPRADVDEVKLIGMEAELGQIDDDAKPPQGGEPVSAFSWTTLHEIGHAVDDRLGYMNKNMSKPAFGAWEVHGSNLKPIAKKVAAEFNYDEIYVEAYMSNSKIDPPEPDASKGCDPTTEKGRGEWEMRRVQVETWCDACSSDAAIYYNDSESAKRQIGGRVYQEAYEDSWVSYDYAARRKGVRGYQFRAPGEFFAELYAAYHTGKMNKNHPARDWLKDL